jgi:DNA-binding NtrC family response regulator
MPPPSTSRCDSFPPAPHWNDDRPLGVGDREDEPASSCHATAILLNELDREVVDGRNGERRGADAEAVDGAETPGVVGLGVDDGAVEEAVRCLSRERGFRVLSLDVGADAATIRSCGVLILDAASVSRRPALASFFDLATPEREFLLVRRRPSADCSIEVYSYARPQLGRLHDMLGSLFPSDKPSRDAADQILGTAPSIRLVRRQIRSIARYPDVNVLVLGETGTGKELVAHAIHDLTAPHEAFVALNCAAISEALFESELFGHERGSYTGAHSAHEGLLEQAGAGTVFLDEIGEMPAQLQPKLLRALETRSFRRVGGRRDIPLRARTVSATNRTLSRQNHDVLRGDLMFRLAGFTVALQPLRTRLSDMVPIAQNFLRDFLKRHARSRPMGFTSAAVAELSQHTWPGNVRELRAIVEQAAILASGALIEAYDIQACLHEWQHPASAASAASTASTASTASARAPDPTADSGLLDEVQREVVLRTLERFQGNLTKAAQELGIARSTLRYRLRRYAPR